MAVGNRTLRGRCLCGVVHFTLEPPVREIIVCHCSRCRRWGGHAWAGTAVPMQRFRFDSGEAEVRWFHESERFSRGFCGLCGSAMFFRPSDLSRMSVTAGSLDSQTGLTLAAHVFIADKGDYYETPQDAPCYAQWDAEMYARISPPAGIAGT
jgi:hypothetical protein